VREIDDRAIGTGKPGPVTNKIQSAFFELVKGKSGQETKAHADWLTYV
jgi:branched-chain amino acid aminotransferase